MPKYVRELKEKYGKFSGIAYCAGISQIKSIQSVEFDDLKSVFDIKYYAPIFMTKGFVDIRCNIGKGSSIVTVAPTGAIGCYPGMSSYAGPKRALISSMQSISREVVKQGIR